MLFIDAIHSKRQRQAPSDWTTEIDQVIYAYGNLKIDSYVFGCSNELMGLVWSDST